jgi:EAL domain-containing protein (putative c-di-GMP-specific phosphodiesterase class I)
MEFLPLLKEAGQLQAVGRWVLASACYQGADWHAKGYRFSVSVNISSDELDDVTFVDVVRNNLRTTRFTPRHLTLEFSAEALAPSRTPVLHELADLGVTLAIDDVIPGTPSVVAMTSAGITEAKLDRELVADAFAEEESAQALHSFVSDARAAGLRIVAAGVEEDSQRTSLLREDVDSAQGFFFARPFEVEEVDHFLEDYALFSGRPL